MSTKIRMSRAGTKKKPFYRIVVTSSRSPRDGDFIEKIGTYNPLLANDSPERVVIDLERAKHWLSVGALPSDRVQLFLFKAGAVSEGPRQKPARKAKKDKGEEAAPAAAPAAAAPKAEAPAPVAEAPVAEAPAAEAPAAEAANDAAA